MPDLDLSLAVERFPLAAPFTIARGARTEAVVVTATVREGPHTGIGECTPYARYGETVDTVIDQLRSAAGVTTRADLAARLPAGAARNALDCALWCLEARRSGRTVAAIAGLSPITTGRQTCYTLSLDTPDAMARAAVAAADKGLLKVKLGAPGDAERMRAVRAARPDARLVADANEGWSPGDLGALLSVAAGCGFELVEQPLPAADDALLATMPRPLPVCADESAHTSADIAGLAGRYDAVNIKLDKAGGLSEAIAMAAAARGAGLRIMVGCMLATSLAMAPAWHLAGIADWLDLDAPLLLARDRVPAMAYAGDLVLPVPPGLWA